MSTQTCKIVEGEHADRVLLPHSVVSRKAESDCRWLLVCLIGLKETEMFAEIAAIIAARRRQRCHGRTAQQRHSSSGAWIKGWFGPVTTRCNSQIYLFLKLIPLFRSYVHKFCFLLHSFCFSSSISMAGGISTGKASFKYRKFILVDHLVHVHTQHVIFIDPWSMC